MKIGVVSYEARGSSYTASSVVDEDLVLEEILNELGVNFKFEIWSDDSVRWENYDLILIKSPWDYFDRYAEFLDWCNKIKSLGLPVYNNIDTIIWNSDKWYLKEIQEKGYPIVPTQFIRKSEMPDIRGAFHQFETDKLIFKPTVSGGAKNTLKILKESWLENKEQILSLIKEEDFMLQPFVKEVAEIGEYSYIFFKENFSHAILKTAKSGDFRVQHFFGGSIQNIVPDIKELTYIQKLVDEFAKNSLYARVDGVWIEGVFYLMELELIEPYLFLFTSDKARENYKNALKEVFK
ncbi:MAG: glutathione synthetase [Mongoliibacter sp.]|uniref:ATP-grasp domain-containing protein n=1 Tax=Mongoliibacter sp. TaxID=2022438 RepID=UPI0012F1B7F1|nr:glutathione synthetase [Mongoliibacter sp.]TVP49659.1 MAG: glutathione synthetase [Mongoliibacter sp.]